MTEIHKFNSSLFFFPGYEVDSVHEKLRSEYSPTCAEVWVYKIRIILFYFCRSNKKSLRILFFLVTQYIHIKYVSFANELCVEDILNKPELIYIETVEWFQILL